MGGSPVTGDEWADGWWQAAFTACLEHEVPVFGRERLVWHRGRGSR